MSRHTKKAHLRSRWAFLIKRDSNYRLCQILCTFLGVFQEFRQTDIRQRMFQKPKD